MLALLGTGIAERICYGLAAVYFATFLQEIYRMSLAATAVPLAIFALGNVVGTIVGGHLADRLRDRLLTFAVTMALSAMAALALFMWHPGPAVTVTLGAAYCLVNALGRPSYMAALAAVPDEVRGTVLGLNGATASVGWVGGRRPRRRHDQHGRFRELWPVRRHAQHVGSAGRARLPALGAAVDFYLRLFYCIIFPD